MRRYKKLNTFTFTERKILRDGLFLLRQFYREIRDYHDTNNNRSINDIGKDFKKLLQTKSGLLVVDAMSELTLKRFDYLLIPLKFKGIPLHNNGSELDIRSKVIKRKISLFHKSYRGAKASDIFMSLMMTCRKLNLSFWDYLRDRISKKYDFPYLAIKIVSD